MAAGGPVEELCEEATCPTCLEYFKDPVTIVECGHNFCRGCLTQCWGEAEASCPQCRRKAQPRNLLPNRHLANVVQIAKKLSLQDRKCGEAMKEEVEKGVCGKHQEPLKLFCQTDQVPICVVCDRSKEHKTHEVIPAGEASQEYKDKIFRNLETLKTEREKILAFLADVRKESREMLKTAESERQKTVAEFRKLHELLQEQENHLLAQVEEVEKEIARERDEHLARLSEQLSSLESLIKEMEEKHQQPVTELLQDIRSNLQRSVWKEHFGNPVAIPPELKWKVQSCCAICFFLGGVMKQFQDTMVTLPLQMKKANVTLNPTTASTKLMLSEDRRSIECRRYAKEMLVKKHVLDCGYGDVLGCEEFTGGCHFWEVSVGGEGGWAVGVAKKSAWATSERQTWVVGSKIGPKEAFIISIDHLLSVSGELKRIRVCLNYDGGRVAFFDADAGTLLYVFSVVLFFGEALHPYFAVCGNGYVRLPSLDS